MVVEIVDSVVIVFDVVMGVVELLSLEDEVVVGSVGVYAPEQYPHFTGQRYLMNALSDPLQISANLSQFGLSTQTVSCLVLEAS